MSQPRDKPHKLLIGQSADPDDAFMAWGLASGRVSIEGAEVEVVFDDIQALNERARQGSLDLTALSAGAYPSVAGGYRLLTSGASFGEEYGPIVVGREPVSSPGPGAVAGSRVAVPGLLTTAYLLLRTYAGDTFTPVPMRFDAIIDAVVSGKVDAGLIIHEGQLTYRDHGLHALFEPARAWHREHGLPVPLGVVGVKRKLGPGLTARLAGAFRASIEAGLAEPEAALAFAAAHGRGVDAATLEAFVDQYVDDRTLDMGDEGRMALRKLYEGAAGAGLLEKIPPLDLL
jgi:1,4-dihydroxy-6-naphthoate synthase